MKKKMKTAMKKNNKKKQPKTKAKTKSAKPKSGSNAHGVSPLGSRVLIKPFTKDELMEKNSFGIILPGADSKEKSEQGVVLAVGVGEYHDGRLVTPQVKAGDKVVFSKYGYEDVTVGGEELYLIKEENILAVLK